jgi:serine/threonine-protein kinase
VPDPILPATVGRYEVVRLLGEGSMGRVLLAHDPVLDRDVAIKHLRRDLEIPRDARQGLLARMRHEARAAARVAHPNLVVLHDMGEDPSVGLYLVFEYVRGPTLKQRLGEPGNLARLTPAEASRLARELGAALHVAHEAGVLHRDVKPENVMLDKTGGKLADFGIARIPDSTLTHQGGLMGTPAYSAPETFRSTRSSGVPPSGEAAKSALPAGHSPLSDQFSLAATLYEAISGERAFPGDDAVSVAARIANDPPPAFAAALGLSTSVDAVLSRALSRRPEDRFSDCDAFGDALARSLAAPPSLLDAQGTAPATAVESPPERRTSQVLLGGALVLVTALLVGRTAMRSAESSPASPQIDDAPAPAATSAPVVPRAHPLPHPPRSPKPRPEASAVAPSSSAAPAGSAEALVDAGATPSRPAPGSASGVEAPGIPPTSGPAVPPTAPQR